MQAVEKLLLVTERPRATVASWASRKIVERFFLQWSTS